MSESDELRGASEEVTAVRAEFASRSTRRKQAVDDAAAKRGARIERTRRTSSIRRTSSRRRRCRRRTCGGAPRRSARSRSCSARSSRCRGARCREAQAAQAQAARGARASARAPRGGVDAARRDARRLTERGCALHECYLGSHRCGERLRLVFTNVDSATRAAPLVRGVRRRRRPYHARRGARAVGAEHAAARAPQHEQRLARSSAPCAPASCALRRSSADTAALRSVVKGHCREGDARALRERGREG